MPSKLAVITWFDEPGGVPTPPIYYPPYPSQPPFPSFPIAPGGSPPSIWPNPGHPAHPIAPGGGPSWGPGFPTPPIYLPPSGQPPIPGWTPPGYHPSHPIAPGGSGGVPTPPIFYPPGIWPSPGYPAHPIAPGGPPPEAGWTPPGTTPTPPISGGWMVVWHPSYGWIVIGAPPSGGGGGEGTPEHPIAGTDLKPDQGLPPTMPTPKK